MLSAINHPPPPPLSVYCVIKMVTTKHVLFGLSMFFITLSPIITSKMASNLKEITNYSPLTFPIICSLYHQLNCQTLPNMAIWPLVIYSIPNTYPSTYIQIIITIHCLYFTTSHVANSHSTPHVIWYIMIYRCSMIVIYYIYTLW